MKIVTVVGTRPNLIKASVLSDLIRKKHDEILVDTGQHYDADMRDIFFEQLKLPRADYELNIGSGTHGRQTGKMLEVLDEVLGDENPDMVLVYGDTNSTLAGALSAAKMNIPLMHVEAGVRSHDKSMPEEINRVIVDRISDVLCCPTLSAFANLIDEGNKGSIELTFDIMLDMVNRCEDLALKRSNIIDHLGLDIHKYYVATIHRASNTDVKDTLVKILTALGKIGHRVIFPLHPRTKNAIMEHNIVCPGNIWFIDPVGHFDMVALVKFARKVITDSGGLQKEAYFMGTPCVTVRETTEWEETLTGGWNVCVGSDVQRILDGVGSEPTCNRMVTSFGVGDAAKRVCDCIDRFDTKLTQGM